MPDPDLIPLNKIIRLPRNPKEHDLGTLNLSMDRFGFLERIVINRTTGHLLSGHGRIDTLRQMKLHGRPAPIGIDAHNGDWLVPVDYVDVDEEEEEAAAIALNKLVETGGWDDNALAEVLSDLAAQGEQMLSGIGFDMQDVDELLKSLQPKDDGQEDTGPEQAEPTIEDYGKLLSKWGLQAGDIWAIAGQNTTHYLACGDSRQIDTWQELTKAAGIEHLNGLFTSPPYAQQRAKRDEWYGGVPEDHYVEWFQPLQECAGTFLTENASFFLNIKPNVVDGARVLYVFDLVLSMCRKWGWQLIDEFCWERIGAPGAWPNRFKNGFEPIYHFARTTDIPFFPEEVAKQSAGERLQGDNHSTGNYYNIGQKVMQWDQVLPSNRLETFGNAMATGHPAAFPTGLPMFFLQAFSLPGDAWIDPFSGSGTLALAAERTGRTALLIELLPEYAAVTLERLSNIGLSPKKVGEL